MTSYWEADILPVIENRGLCNVVDYVLSGDNHESGEVKCGAEFHGSFDNDASTLNSILHKILYPDDSKYCLSEFEGFTDEQLNRGDF